MQEKTRQNAEVTLSGPTKTKINSMGNQNPYRVEYDASEPEAPLQQELSEESETAARKKTLSIIRILIGLAIILVSAALLVALLNWLKQDVTTSLLFFESEIQ